MFLEAFRRKLFFSAQGKIRNSGITGSSQMNVKNSEDHNFKFLLK